MTMSAKDASAKLMATVSQKLITLSHGVHANPELAYEEFISSRMTADALATDSRFTINMGAGGIETAFTATAGSGPLHLGICAEYDALPGIGHACGHNIIAAAAVGTGLALAELADELGITVTVFGCPAEEGSGGKIRMLDAGLFDGVHAAMMVHASPHEADRMHCLAVSHFDVDYHGRTAHASAFPQQGINAADAITVAQVGIGLLRQHIRPTDRIHGIVIKGGDAPNIVPDHTVSKWYVRGRTLEELTEIEARVQNVFAAGALATGCTHTVTSHSKPYSEFLDDEDMVAIYRANAEGLGRSFPAPQKRRPEGLPHDGEHAFSASTDMANVSLRIPSIHPMLGLDCAPASNHQPEFTAACITQAADKAVIDGATAMAWTCIDLAINATQRSRLLAAT
jgi:amidohydrolase